MTYRKPYRLAASITVLLAASVITNAQSVISTLDNYQDTVRRTNGIVSNLGEGTIDDETYASAIAFQDWNSIQQEFDEYSGNDKSLDNSMNHTHQEITTLVNSKGMAFNLPTMVDENGIDLYLLTDEGITIYSAMDAPIYLQDIDQEIVKWVRFYAYHKRDYTKRLFSRYDKWQSKLKEHFRNSNIPEELTELCLIESGCTYTAVSSAGAVGMWQLMPATAQQYGLTVNYQTDQRKDPMLSSYVAAKVLTANYARTGDWTLAAAAYNCGAGRVLSGAKKAGSTEWSDIKGTLPKETRQYIPSLLAIHYVWTYRDKLGL